tara:strand:+ start:91 stop:261 length:171 start_codon:yes stop_codon:yes gene_type:complete
MILLLVGPTTKVTIHSIFGSLASPSLSIENTPVEILCGTSKKKNLKVDVPALIPLY